MDKKSFHTLEFDKVLHILAGYTSFSGGEELALGLEPTTDIDEARRWQAETREAQVLLNTNTSVTIGGARDVRRMADNAVRGFTLPAEDILEIRNTIVSGRNLRRILTKPETAEKYPHLFAIGDLIEECPTLVSTITTTIDDRGEVLDSASPKLAKIRSELRVMYGRIQEKLQRILNSTLNQYLQEPLVTMRNGRYVIPLKADAKGRIKGIVHDQSGSGATLWIEPIGTVELNNEFRSLELQEEQEIQRILAELSAKIGQQADSIKRVVDRLAELDLIFARARYASEIRAYEPEFVEWRKIEQAKPPKHANELDKWVAPPPNLHPGSTIWIKAARHPLLNPETVVPTDLTLDDETFVVLITGPNTGGKTVSLKTMGLMVLMAQSGLHLPAQYARMTLFDHVFADIGDEQSIEQSLSTFSAHMSNIIRILKLIDDRSLVLLDELGSGTDPGEGAALAMSITNYLRDKGATTFIATHYPELKVYASQTSGVTNASMLFDIETLSPTYEMTIGIPGRSNAFAIARRLGLDDTILDEAIKMVGTGSHKAEGILDAIYQLRDKITAEEAATRLALREAEQERENLHQRLEQIEVERRRILQEARDQAKADLEAVQNELRQMRRQMRDAASLNALKKVTQQVEELETAQNRPLETAVSPITPVKPRKKGSKGLQVGDIVLIKTLNTKGEIISVSNGELLVAVGRLHMRTKPEELEFKERPEDEEESTPIMPLAASPGMELDLRGKRVEEGLGDLERYLDTAFLARMPWVRIIHGKGTGKMREAVRKALAANSYITSWEEGKDGEGGSGVTVVKLVEHK